jgi:hypothetical protein
MARVPYGSDAFVGVAHYSMFGLLRPRLANMPLLFTSRELRQILACVFCRHFIRTQQQMAQQAEKNILCLDGPQ